MNPKNVYTSKQFFRDLIQFWESIIKIRQLWPNASIDYYPTTGSSEEFDPNTQKAHFEFDPLGVPDLLRQISEGTNKMIKQCDSYKEMLLQSDQQHKELVAALTFHTREFAKYGRWAGNIRKDCFLDRTENFTSNKKDLIGQHLTRLVIRSEQLRSDLIKHINEQNYDSQ